MRWKKVLLLSLATVWLAACGASEREAASFTGTPAVRDEPAAQAPPTSDEAPSTSALLAENSEGEENAPAPETSRPPAEFEGNWYVLLEGETLEAFAAAHGIDAGSFEMRPIDAAWFGELEAHISEHHPQIKDAWGGRITLPHWGISHVVEAGEDIWSLATRFHTSAVELLVANDLQRDDAQKLTEGRRILIPGVLRDKRGKVVRVDMPLTVEDAARAKRLKLGKRSTAGALLGGRMKDEWVSAAGGETGAGSFLWPVSDGWLVRGFGTGEEGYHKAVDIGGQVGWPVRSIDDGIVAYAGDELRGYGNIVMVMHAGGFVSFYAHLSHSFVRAGEILRRGEALAELGSTGISRGPHVHFELIRHPDNCDPEPLFRPDVRKHNGDVIDVTKVDWTGEGRAPSGLRCEPRPAHHPNSRYVVHEDPHSDAEARAGAAPRPATAER